MSLTKLKYGVETSSPTKSKDDYSLLSWIIVIIFVIAAISFVATLLRRISSSPEEEPAPKSNLTLESSPLIPSSAEPLHTDEVRPEVVNNLQNRSAKMRSLLLRYKKATEVGNLEMQISTIEQICNLKGNDAAPDVVNALLPSLGKLNLIWLFDKHNPQWVTTVKVRPGDTATRIANEHGSTVGSMTKLNGWQNANNLVSGSEVKVMDHPRFEIVVLSRSSVVDLYLNGKIFKRYAKSVDLSNISLAPGEYKTPQNLINFFYSNNIILSKQDAAELNMLVPRNAPLSIKAQ